MPNLSNVYLEIDASELSEEIAFLRSVMNEGTFMRVMYYTVRDTSRHISAILRKDLPPQYHVNAGEITRAVKAPKMTFGGGGVSCAIPLTAPRKTIGGGFGASGSARGWQSLHKKYRVKARIVKAGQSTLPSSMSSYGGQPPFRNIPSSLGGLTYTRMGKGRFPIKSVVGIAVPQMPMNRSREAVEADIMQYMDARLIHYASIVLRV